MINWKKEGYYIGQKVCLVCKNSYMIGESILEGEVTYVGTKALKVIRGNKKLLHFQGGKNHCRGLFIGEYFVVFKSEKDYEAAKKEEAKKVKLIDKTKGLLYKLSCDDLEKVIKLAEAK